MIVLYYEFTLKYCDIKILFILFFSRSFPNAQWKCCCKPDLPHTSIQSCNRSSDCVVIWWKRSKFEFWCQYERVGSCQQSVIASMFGKFCVFAVKHNNRNHRQRTGSTAVTLSSDLKTDLVAPAPITTIGFSFSGNMEGSALAAWKIHLDPNRWGYFYAYILSTNWGCLLSYSRCYHQRHHCNHTYHIRH